MGITDTYTTTTTTTAPTPMQAAVADSDVTTSSGSRPTESDESSSDVEAINVTVAVPVLVVGALDVEGCNTALTARTKLFKSTGWPAPPAPPPMRLPSPNDTGAVTTTVTTLCSPSATDSFPNTAADVVPVSKNQQRRDVTFGGRDNNNNDNGQRDDKKK